MVNEMSRNETRPPWKKTLYDNKQFPDNYTDSSFLLQMRKNIHIRHVTLTEAINGAALLSVEISAICLFCVIFVYLYNDWIEPQSILGLSSILTVIGCIAYKWKSHKTTESLPIGTLTESAKTMVIFLVFGYISSPVLHTLTDTISTDTIYSMTFLMMIVHLIFFDYGVPAACVSKSLSLNAAIFASTCLASRLSSPFHAFVLMTVAFECFALFPRLRFLFDNQLVILLGLTMFDLSVLWYLSVTMTCFFTLLLLFINVLCPYLFIKWTRFKENIYGPWDEAIVRDIDGNLKDLFD